MKFRINEIIKFFCIGTLKNTFYVSATSYNNYVKSKYLLQASLDIIFGDISLLHSATLRCFNSTLAIFVKFLLPLNLYIFPNIYFYYYFEIMCLSFQIEDFKTSLSYFLSFFRSSSFFFPPKLKKIFLSVFLCYLSTSFVKNSFKSNHHENLENII